MTIEWLDKMQKKINKMGRFELEDYKATVVNSLRENPSKFFLYDLIDTRLATLDLESASVVCDDSGFETISWSER